MTSPIPLFNRPCFLILVTFLTPCDVHVCSLGRLIPLSGNYSRLKSFSNHSLQFERSTTAKIALYTTLELSS